MSRRPRDKSLFSSPHQIRTSPRRHTPTRCVSEWHSTKTVSFTSHFYKSVHYCTDADSYKLVSTQNGCCTPSRINQPLKSCISFLDPSGAAAICVERLATG